MCPSPLFSSALLSSLRVTHKSSGGLLPPQAPPQTNQFLSQWVHQLQPVPQPPLLVTRMPSIRSRYRTLLEIEELWVERTSGRVRRHHQL